MITIRLLGGAKKAVGRQTISLERTSVSVMEILQFLSGASADPRLLQPNNLIIAINGVDTAALQGHQTMVKTGDIVTVVTVVHGGTEYTMGSYRVLIMGFRQIKGEPGKFLDGLRRHDNDV